MLGWGKKQCRSVIVADGKSSRAGLLGKDELNGHRLRRARADGRPQHGDHTIRTGRISRGTNAGSCARDRGSLAVYFWHDWSRPADDPWWQHYPADQFVRENPVRGF